MRWDHLVTNYPDSTICGPGYTASCTKEISYPKGSTPGLRWDDVTPRMAAAYDLFGTGRTALKFNLGKYMETYTVGSDLDLHPLIRTTISTTRSWTDTNKDFVPNCTLSNPEKNGECGEMNDKTLGKEVFNRTYDPNFIHGYGVRPYNWGLGIQVQQEVLSRVSVNVGYFRNWWGNWYTVDNRATTAADYTPFSIRAPVDPRLPDGGGYIVSGLYNLVPAKVGLVDEWATSSKNYAQQVENWQGVDVDVSARLRNGITAQGGTSTGRRLSDSCALKAAVPEQGTGTRGANTSLEASRGSGFAAGSVLNPYCRIVDPYRTHFGGSRVHDSAYRCPGQRHVGFQPQSADPGQLRGEQRGHRRRAAAAWSPPLRRRSQRHREPHSTIDGLRGAAAEQHRHACLEDHPVGPNEDAGRRRYLQPHERGHHTRLQLCVQSQHNGLADADVDCAAAVREVQRADRLLTRECEDMRI